MKKFIKENWFRIIVLLAIFLASFLIMFLLDYEHLLKLFFLLFFFLLAIVWFFSTDKKLKELREEINKHYPFCTKIVAGIFRITMFLVFLCAVFLIILGAPALINKVKQDKLEHERQRIRAEQEKIYAPTEQAYQKCLDKVAALTIWETRPVDKSDGKLHLYSTYTVQKNIYFDEWKNNNSPYYEPKNGYWEKAFMKWLIEKHSPICEEFNIESIKYFLDTPHPSTITDKNKFDNRIK